MRISTASLQARRPSSVAGAELDVTPVMNMFIILIPFLISMTAFTHLATHEFSLPGDEASDHASARADVPLTVALGAAGVLLAQADLVIAELPRATDGLDYLALRRLLADQRPGKLVVAVDDAIETAEIVACLDACRAAGCTDIGLAAGTGVVLSKEREQ